VLPVEHKKFAKVAIIVVGMLVMGLIVGLTVHGTRAPTNHEVYVR